MRVAVFDIDGTLLDSVGDHGYAEAAAVLAGTVPNPVACCRVKGLIQDGWEIYYLTGRGRHLVEATLQQLRRHVDAGVDEAHVIHQESWRGYSEMQRYKAEHLNRLQPAWYCGDQRTDELAALDAGIPFIHAEAWRRGESIQAPETLLG